MKSQTQPPPRIPDEPAEQRECRLTIIRCLSQRTSGKVPWFRAIGVQNAEVATAGLLECQSVVPRDILRLLELPPRVTWAKLAVFLRSSIPADEPEPSPQTR